MNKFLDSLPRPRLACLGREVPTFRSCGIAGFYVALIISFGAVLLTGRSLVVFAALAIVSGLSFYSYAHLWKWITGYEDLVLLEHVWFALACNAGALCLMRQPLLPYLDVVSIGLCFFLAAGRIGCTLVGCCHGHPSSFGITYNAADKGRVFDAMHRDLLSRVFLADPATATPGAFGTATPMRGPFERSAAEARSLVNPTGSNRMIKGG